MTIAKKRANKMLDILANVSYEKEPGREYDDCVEMGDGSKVIFELMKEAHNNPKIMGLLKSYPACQYVNLVGWQKTYNAEAQKEIK